MVPADRGRDVREAGRTTDSELEGASAPPQANEPTSLAQRSVTAVTWTLGANAIKIVVLVARSILLARLLPVETFGVYALATSLVTLSGILPMWGLGSAYLHRSPETADAGHAAAVHFTLRLILTLVWALALIALSLLLANGPLQQAIVVLTLVFGGLYLCDTPKAVLARRVQHRRLAVLELANAVLTTVVGVGLARRGYGLTALLATDVVTLALTVLLLYLWRPVFRPRLLWARHTARYFLAFGSRAMAQSALAEALDNIDDIWTGTFLGSTALGLYSRAFTFATYPRRLLALPVNAVAGGALAELKGNRAGLSAAFSRTSALLIRSGFLLTGLLMLIAPEFVRLALGDKWLPMVPTFRLMTLFALLDPLQGTVSTLFNAVGQPAQVVRVRLVQLGLLTGGLYLLGRTWGISGVAVGVNLALIFGLGFLLVKVRVYVDFSVRQLFLAPGMAVTAGAAAAWAASFSVCRQAIASPGCTAGWIGGALKAAAFLAVFVAVLFGLEREMLRSELRQVWRTLAESHAGSDRPPLELGESNDGRGSAL